MGWMEEDAGEGEVTRSLTLGSLGGETVVHAMVRILIRSFYDTDDVHTVTDGMALQRLWDASRTAVAEMSGGRDRVELNVPYLTVDAKMRPRPPARSFPPPSQDAEVSFSRLP